MSNNSQKRENLLNLALDSNIYEMERSLNLGVGTNEDGDIWTVIVKYVGNIDFLINLGVEVETLLGGYAILRLNRDLIDYVTSLDEIIFMEKPKGLVFSQVPLFSVASETCITSVKNIEGELTGEGITIAVIDSGIDYENTVFRNPDGTTRIVNIWDQTTGKIYGREDINYALETGEKLDTMDFSGHGTAVAAIAAGDFAEYIYGDRVKSYGIATKADILAIKLASEREGGFPTTSQLMRAIDYAVKYGINEKKAIVINLSFGNTYGSHDGTSILETYIDIAASTGRTTIVAGSGNEGNAPGHTDGVVKQNEETAVEISIENFESSINVQIWKNFVDIFNITVETPAGQRFFISENESGTYRYNTGNEELLVYYGEPKPYSIFQEVYIDIIPNIVREADRAFEPEELENEILDLFTGGNENYVTSGIWKVRIYGKRIVDGKFDMWLPAASTLNGSGFTRPTPETTLTIPSTASSVITVGAYNSYTGNYAPFSGRGYNRDLDVIKPDVVAPGVNIVTTTSGGGLVEMTGTSFATPVVSGIVALLNENGIVRGNDIYMYGEKVKAYLIRNARSFQGENTPNRRTGWGRVCLKKMK